MKLIFYFIFILMISCSKSPINQNVVKKNQPKDQTPPSTNYCADINAYNKGLELPCSCYSGYISNSAGDTCIQNAFDYLKPSMLSYFSTVLQYYKGDTPNITPIITNCNEDIECNFSIQPPLPNGLTFDSLTGKIGGIPQNTNYNSFVYVVTVSNEYGTLNQTLYLKIIDLPPSEISLTNQNFELNKMLNEPLIYTSGIGSVSEISVTPPLPNGISIIKENNLFFLRGSTNVYDKTIYTFTARNSYGMISTTKKTLRFDKKITYMNINHSNCLNTIEGYECIFEYGTNYPNIFFESDSFNYDYTTDLNLLGLTQNMQNIAFSNTIIDHSCFNEFCSYNLIFNNGISSLAKILKIKIINSANIPSFTYENVEIFKNETKDILPIFNGVPDCYGKINCFTANFPINSYTGDVSITKSEIGTFNIQVVAHDSRQDILYNSNIIIKQLIPSIMYNPNYFEVGDIVTLNMESTCQNIIDYYNISNFPNELQFNNSPFTCNNNSGQITGTFDRVYNDNIGVSACNASGCLNKQINLIINPKIKKVVAGLHHACMLDSLNNVYCWGSNEFGQLNISDDTCGSIMCNKSAKLISSNIVDITSGDNYNCFLESTGNVFCYGKGFTDKQYFDTNEKIIAIDSGISDVCLLTESFKLICNGTIFGNMTEMSTDIINFSMGEKHVCYYSSQNIGCQGDNSLNQLGSGDTQININQIFVEPPYEKIVSGRNHNCVIKNNESYCWGDNRKKQLENSNISFKTMIQYEGIANLNVDRTYINFLILGFNILNSKQFDFRSHVESDFYCYKDPNLKCVGANDFGQSSLLIFR